MNTKISTKIGFFGSCQLHLCDKFFLNKQMLKTYNYDVVFSLGFYLYDPNFGAKRNLDYSIFNDIDILIIEINSLPLDNQASSKRIINYLKDKSVKIIKTFLIKFPIYPINLSGYGDLKKNYLNWCGLDNINYKERFKMCIEKMRKSNIESDLSTEITDFVENNFNKHLLFTHSMHPTNILVYQLWKYILQNIDIDINNHKYNLNPYFFGAFDFNHMKSGNVWYQPFPIKMAKDLNIQFTNVIVDDQFYIDRYNKNKSAFLKV